MEAQNVIRMTPGLTRHAVVHVQNIASTFNMFITPAVEKIIPEMTSLEGFHKYGDNRKRMDEIELLAYIRAANLSRCV